MIQQRSSSSLFYRRHYKQFWHLQGCPLYDIVHPAFPLPTTASPTLQSALKNGFGDNVMACDMHKPCKFPSLDSCQRRFLWTHKEVDLALRPVVGLVLQVGDAEKFPQALGFQRLDPFLRVSKLGLTAVEEDGYRDITTLKTDTLLFSLSA